MHKDKTISSIIKKHRFVKRLQSLVKTALHYYINGVIFTPKTIKTSVMKKSFYILLICGAAWLVGCEKEISVQSFPTTENNFAVADGTKIIIPNDNGIGYNYRFYANGASSENVLAFSNASPYLW